ncbi:unnamed protein product [Cylicocyclus nassatus]|uniref:Uncharacterized protein n=1 Tax=Cylicocyclus nassatus TaxID=53992 RepID=A0AA36MCK3_CYLNA|nr:unnamed protein product [Cylicocyclus nassatus]
MRWASLVVPLCWCITPPNEDLKDIDSSAGYDLASEMLTKSINFSVDPCEDFFEFSCGHWIAHHPIPKDDFYISPMDVLTAKVEEQMRDIFESKEVFQSRSMNALKAIYKRCMDIDELNRIGAKRMIEDIRSFGVWPILEGDEKWKEKEFDLTALLIHFDQGSISLGGPAYYLQREQHGKNIEALRNYIINQVELFQKDGDLPTNKTKIGEDTDEIIDLETKMAEILVANKDRRNFTTLYNLRHLSDMRKLTPVVGARPSGLAALFLAIAPSASHEYLKSDPEIIIKEIDYLKRINELLETTDPRIITNYVLMRYSSSWEGEMGEKYEDNAQEFDKEMYGRQEKFPRWKVCTSSTMQRMLYAISALYVRKAFDQASKNVTLEMVDDLLAAFRQTLIMTDWMDDRTRADALEKVDQILPKIAYPDFILDNEKLDQYYDGLDIRDNDSYSEMLEKVSRWDIECSFKRLPSPVNRSEYDNFNSVEVNGYYEPQSNSIAPFSGFSAAILQAPLFHLTFPRALNYGGLGSLIGHEITHGFDDAGRQFDANGNLAEWWDAKVKKNFENRAQCMINQYGKIEVPGTGLKINGKFTQGENIADNGGVKQAFKAYKAYLQKHGGKEDRIKGLEQFDNEQMFFLGFAIAKCERSTYDYLIHKLLTSNHPPNRYRVNQVLANQHEFAAAFKCKVGSIMNPVKRCSLW